MSKENTIQILCQSNDNDELRIVSTTHGMRVGFVLNGNLAGTIVMGRSDAQRLEKFISNEYPAEPKPVAPGREYSFDGLGSKLLRIEPVNGNGQLVLAVCDSDGKHHIVMDKCEATRLAQRLHWEYLFDVAKVQDYQAAAAPQAAPATPNWTDNPGTMTFDAEDDVKFEVSLAQENLTVALGCEGDFGYDYVHLDMPNVDALITHLQHCRHHMHGLVRVKEVPDYSGPAPKPTYVVMDMQGEPQCVLHSEAAVAQYLSTNKLRVAQ